MAEVNFSYPRVLIRAPTQFTHQLFFDGRTRKPAAEPLQRAVPSPVALGFSTTAAVSRGTSMGLAQTC